MDATSPSWPTREDYDLAMDSLNKNVHDSVIKYGKLLKDNTGIVRHGGAGIYVTLYRVDNWMVRCFCRDDVSWHEPPDDIQYRYQYISNFCDDKANLVTALVPVTYVAHAIDVDFIDRKNDEWKWIKTECLPFVRMPFIDGTALGGFIAVNYKNNAIMRKLCETWVQMISDLEKVHMAHGDLDLTNVIVSSQGPNMVLKLIDYDNAWVPALGTNRKQTEQGHEHFQHPELRSKNRYINAEMDRFPALSIYISLKTLSVYPNLYDDWGADTDHRLLLSRTDYEAEMRQASNQITFLRTMQIPELDLLLNELSSSLREKRQPQSLTQLLRDKARVGWEEVIFVEEPNNGQTPSPPDGEEEVQYVYTDWSSATYFKAENEPLVPAQSEQQVAPSPFALPVPVNQWPEYSPEPRPDPGATTERDVGEQQQQLELTTPYLARNQHQDTRDGTEQQSSLIWLWIAIPNAIVIFIIALFALNNNVWVWVVMLIVTTIMVIALFVLRKR